MPTYSDLLAVADAYLHRQLAAFAKRERGLTELRTDAEPSVVPYPDKWAVLREDDDRQLRDRLSFYQDWLVHLHDSGVYDGPTTLTYYGDGDGDRGSD